MAKTIDIDMPKNCYECFMNKGEYTPNEIEKRYCYLTSKPLNKSNYKRRPQNCPLNDIQRQSTDKSVLKAIVIR